MLLQGPERKHVVAGGRFFHNGAALNLAERIGSTWVPLTSNSAEDNIRPIVVAGGSAKVLVWMRGTYRHWTNYDTRIVARTF